MEKKSISMLVMCKNTIVQKVKSLYDSIDTKKLLNDSRLATGVWPTDGAAHDMIRSYIGLLKSTRSLILLSKVSFDLEILDIPIFLKVIHTILN